MLNDLSILIQKGLNRGKQGGSLSSLGRVSHKGLGLAFCLFSEGMKIRWGNGLWDQTSKFDYYARLQTSYYSLQKD